MKNSNLKTVAPVAPVVVVGYLPSAEVVRLFKSRALNKLKAGTMVDNIAVELRAAQAAMAVDGVIPKAAWNAYAKALKLAVCGVDDKSEAFAARDLSYRVTLSESRKRADLNVEGDAERKAKREADKAAKAEAAGVPVSSENILPEGVTGVMTTDPDIAAIVRALSGDANLVALCSYLCVNDKARAAVELVMTATPSAGAKVRAKPQARPVARPAIKPMTAAA